MLPGQRRWLSWAVTTPSAAVARSSSAPPSVCRLSARSALADWADEATSLRSTIVRASSTSSITEAKLVCAVSSAWCTGRSRSHSTVKSVLTPRARATTVATSRTRRRRRRDEPGAFAGLRARERCDGRGRDRLPQRHARDDGRGLPAVEEGSAGAAEARRRPCRASAGPAELVGSHRYSRSSLPSALPTSCGHYQAACARTHRFSRIRRRSDLAQPHVAHRVVAVLAQHQRGPGAGGQHVLATRLGPLMVSQIRSASSDGLVVGQRGVLGEVRARVAERGLAQPQEAFDVPLPDVSRPGVDVDGEVEEVAQGQSGYGRPRAPGPAAAR